MVETDRYFCFVEYKEIYFAGEKALTANLPEGVRYRNLCTCWNASWAIYECYLPEDFKFSEIVTEITGELGYLLYSASDYPPALGFSRDEIFWIFKDNPKPSREEFTTEYIKLLEKYLKSQPYDNCFLAKSLVNHGFRMENYYYWVVGFNKEKNKIYHLSKDDYNIYDGDIEDFKIEDLNLLKRLKNYDTSENLN